jgi:hypothetical protein
LLDLIKKFAGSLEPGVLGFFAKQGGGFNHVVIILIIGGIFKLKRLFS